MRTAPTAAEPTNKKKQFFYGWIIVGVLFFISIIDGGFTYIFSAFLKPLSQEFGWTRAETAGAFSLYLLAAGLTLPLWGWLADRRGVRLVFLLSALIDGVALALLSTVSSLTAFYLLYFILGVGLGGIGPATVGKAVSQWFVAKRGLAMGLALVGGGGGLLLVPLSGFLIEIYNWRIAYVGLAGLALGGMFPLVWFFLTDTPGERGLTPLGQSSHTNDATKAEGESRLEPGDWTLKEALFTSTFWLLGVAFCAGLMVGLAMIAHQVAILQDAGFTLESASTIAGVTLGMSMGGRLVVGWASEHARYLHPMLSLCLLMQAAGIGSLLYLNVLGLWATVTAFTLLFGLGYGGLVVLWPLVIGHDFGLRAFGAIAGVLGTVAASLGGAVGPVVAGAIYDSTGSYHWAFFLFIAVLLVGTGAAWAATEPSPARLSLAPEYIPGQKQEL